MRPPYGQPEGVAAPPLPPLVPLSPGVISPQMDVKSQGNGVPNGTTAELPKRSQHRPRLPRFRKSGRRRRGAASGGGGTSSADYISRHAKHPSLLPFPAGPAEKLQDPQCVALPLNSCAWVTARSILQGCAASRFLIFSVCDSFCSCRSISSSKSRRFRTVTRSSLRALVSVFTSLTSCEI